MALSTSSVVLLRKISSFLSLSLVHYLVLYSSSCCLHCTSSTGDWSFEKWGPGDDGYIQGNSFFFSGSFQSFPFKCLQPESLKTISQPISWLPRILTARKLRAANGLLLGWWWLLGGAVKRVFSSSSCVGCVVVVCTNSIANGAQNYRRFSK